MPGRIRGERRGSGLRRPPGKGRGRGIAPYVPDGPGIRFGRKKTSPPAAASRQGMPPESAFRGLTSGPRRGAPESLPDGKKARFFLPRGSLPERRTKKRIIIFICNILI